MTEGELALLQINIGLNIWACQRSVSPLRAPGIIESGQIGIWANEWIVPRDPRGFSRLEMVMCGNSFHCLARCGGGGGGGVLLNGREVARVDVTVSFIASVMMKLVCPRGLK